MTGWRPAVFAATVVAILAMTPGVRAGEPLATDLTGARSEGARIAPETVLPLTAVGQGKRHVLATGATRSEMSLAAMALAALYMGLANSPQFTTSTVTCTATTSGPSCR